MILQCENCGSKLFREETTYNMSGEKATSKFYFRCGLINLVVGYWISKTRECSHVVDDLYGVGLSEFLQTLSNYPFEQISFSTEFLYGIDWHLGDQLFFTFSRTLSRAIHDEYHKLLALIPYNPVLKVFSKGPVTEFSLMRRK